MLKEWEVSEGILTKVGWDKETLFNLKTEDPSMQKWNKKEHIKRENVKSIRECKNYKKKIVKCPHPDKFQTLWRSSWDVENTISSK